MAVFLEQRDDIGEVRVETGTGFVDEQKRGERNVQLKIRSDNRAVVDPVTGWADTAEPTLAFVADDIVGRRVRYRIETHRRDGAPEKPLAQLRNREKLREIISLELADAAAPRAAEATAPPASDRSPAEPSGSPATTGASQPDGRGPGAQPEHATTDDDDTEPAPPVQRTGADNPGFAATLVNMAAAQVEMAAKLQPDHAAAPRLTKAGATLRKIGLELMGVG